MTDNLNYQNQEIKNNFIKNLQGFFQKAGNSTKENICKVFLKGFC